LSDDHRGMKPTRVLVFVFAVVLTAICGTVLLFPYRVADPVLGLSLLASLAVMTGTGVVRVPGTKISVQVSDAFVFTALAAYGPMPACFVAAAAGFAAIFGKERHRRPLHVVFNIGNLVTSVSTGSAVYLLSGGRPGAPVLDQLGPLFAATVVYLGVNTILVTVAIKLDSGRGIDRSWRESMLWTAMSTFIGLTLAVFLTWALEAMGTTGLALGVPPAWLLALFYRTHKERQIAAQDRVEAVEEVNVGLEGRVAERTRDLRQALGGLEDANRQLVSTNARLEEANEAKSLFLASVSHELRTPLNAVIGFADLLRDPCYGPLNQEQAEFICDIQESGEHLLRLINDILDVTKIEANKMEARLEEFDVRQALGEATSMLRSQATANSLLLEVDCADDVTAARLDPGMFRQVLVNLIGNAVKFTHEAGEIQVRAEREDDALLIIVEDTGIGIAAQDLERIFDEFHQVDNTYSRNYEGTGLGLALVRRMVELQGGEVSVESTQGEGTRFTCRFADCLRARIEPIKELLQPAEAAYVVPDEQPVEKRDDERTILIVEDNPLNRKLARNVLKSHGYRILEAESGEIALELLATHRPDLVLMDLQLPKLDGLELTRRLLADPANAGLPIVALTAHALEADAEQARAAGCVGFITKPIRLSEFPGQVSAHLSSTVKSGTS